ncbi:MAG: DEAD/DEAH box helicase [Planctomycetota bacterium]|nr:DEAD/DEAH box helicase [Planctomycetota bacterium]
MLTLRPYQREAVEAVYRYLREHDDNPCVVIPTAGGKTPVLATICTDAVGLWHGRVLVLAHVKELLQQAADKLQAICPEVPVGVYSAGLGSRDTLAPVIVAGIQSAYRRASELGHFDLALVDEAHCIPADGEGMYRTLLADLKRINPRLRVIGLTATPFRMTSGPICARENILNAICYEVGVRELIVQGYLCPLVTKAGKDKAETDRLHIRGGEFIAGEVEALMDNERLVESACKEIVQQTRERRACLIFASGVPHGNHVAEKVASLGQRVAAVFGDTLDDEREQSIADFRAGRLKYLVNVNVLTTGFDAPNIDCVAMLRPTMSPGLWYQCCGRGFRLHPGKQDCFILDFGGNALRHGPVDALKIKDRNGSSCGEAPAKECPNCQSVIATGYTVCPQCSHEFERNRTRHDAQAGTAGVLSGQVSVATYPVQEVTYAVHVKRNAPPDAPRTMRVEYKIGWQQYQSEWICFEHTGFARHKAEAWWKRRSSEPVPDTAEQAVALAVDGALCETKSITVRSVAGEDFSRIVGYELANAATPVAEPDESYRDEPEPEYVPAEDDVPF